jgi:hypothetical protein
MGICFPFLDTPYPLSSFHLAGVNELIDPHSFGSTPIPHLDLLFHRKYRGQIKAFRWTIVRDLSQTSQSSLFQLYLLMASNIETLSLPTLMSRALLTETC